MSALREDAARWDQNPNMDLFSYKNRTLHCEEVAIPALAEKYGTPLYVYSQGTLLHHLEALQTAFAAAAPLICYSIKVNGNIHLARLMVENGAGCDVTSAGELYRALKAGCPAQKIVFAGVGKTSRRKQGRSWKKTSYFSMWKAKEKLLALWGMASSFATGKVARRQRCASILICPPRHTRRPTPASKASSSAWTSTRSWNSPRRSWIIHM